MRRRRAVLVFIVGSALMALLAGAVATLIEDTEHSQIVTAGVSSDTSFDDSQDLFSDYINTLEELEVKGKAPKTGYSRSEFGNGWAKVNGCSTRDIILYRDLDDVVLDESCKVVSGTLLDPYTAKTIEFSREASSDIQIDHVIALSDAWQKGAQQLTREERIQLANDPLELLAVEGKANQQKSDADAASWLPKNKAFRCEYVARQIDIKKKYRLWVTLAEKQAMAGVLENC